MVNMLKILAGLVLFVVGYMISVLLKFMFIDGDILGVMSTMGLNSTVHGIIWFGLFCIWGIALLVLPIGVQVTGIMEMEDKTGNQMFNMVIAVLSFLFGILLTIQLWKLNWPTAFADILSGQTILSSFYWIGLLITWVTAVLIAPVMSIIQARDG